MKYFLSAGEASGDLHAGALVAALKQRDVEAEFAFLGGDEMSKAAGCAPLIHYREMAYMGFGDVIRNIDKVMRNLRVAKRAISAGTVDAVILVDYPSFNLKLAKHAYELGIPVYYYISPKVWAWKEWRIKSIRRYCRKVLSILPFEVDYFHRHNMEVVYVGNPSVEEIEQRRSGIPPCDVFRRQWSLDAEKPLLALVPGSRVSEIKSNLPIMNAVAQRYPQFQAVVAAAPNIDDALYAEFTDCKVVKNATFNLVGNSTCALVTSGTATLETAILGVPQVVCYRNSGSKLFYDVMKHFIKCPYISLPNLIADKAVVPEMLMHLCTADSVSAELGKIVPGAEGRDAMLAGYALMRERLGRSTTAAETAAKVIVDELSK